ncbi:MAG: signal peptide peptidase SppA [Acidithiobacillus sp.]|uniref:signal peptide peptidase SppA n=1 Tax=Acidithiobacillus sp. TaxID=1872118 RepID=UPI003D00CEF9
MASEGKGSRVFLLAVLFFLLLAGAVGAIHSLPGYSSLGNGQAFIAEVRIDGPIFDAKKTMEALRRVAENPQAKGLLLVINSPGGAVVPSWEIHDLVARIARKKPVAVSMQSLAASGGYLIACAGSRIFAYGATATGSIGVILQTFSLSGLMDKIGIQGNAIVSGPLKDAGSPFSSMSAADRKYLQGIVMNIRDQFVQLVADDRHIPPAKVDALATGQVYTGLEAQKLGLVDAIGGEHAATKWLLAQLKLPKDTPVRAVHGENTWSGWFSAAAGSAIADLLAQSTARFYLF